MEPGDQFTNLVNEALNTLGYSMEMVELRRSAYNSWSDGLSASLNNLVPDLSATISGSKREGLSGVLQSDIDIMVTDNSILCTDTPTRAGGNVSSVFQLDQDGVPPGYTNLRLYDAVQHSGFLMDESLFEVPSKGVYMSSSFFMFGRKLVEEHGHREPLSPFERYFKRKHQSGPSLPIETKLPYDLGSSNTDNVYALPCECSHYLISWLERPRKYEWPSQQLIQIVATLDSHVVPVGAKGSPDAFSQWRICYTHAEIELMQSLEETHWKLYALLRMLKDEAFQFAEGVITSYVLKNIVMWMAESNPTRLFQIHFLLDRLTQALRVLRLCVRKAYLPSYMIHERNLFEDRLNPDIQGRLLHKLNELILEGPSMVYRCKALKRNMDILIKTPDMTAHSLEQHNNYETWILSSIKSVGEKHPELWQKLILRGGNESFIEVWLSTICNDPRSRKIAVDMAFCDREYFRTACAKLSTDTPLLQKSTQCMLRDKGCMDAAAQLMSNPQIAQGIHRLVQKQTETQEFQNAAETIVRKLMTLEENIDLTKLSPTHLAQWLLTSHPDMMLKILQNVVATMGMNTDLCRAISESALNNPEPFVKTVLANFNFSDISRLLTEYSPTGTNQSLEFLRRL